MRGGFAAAAVLGAPRVTVAQTDRDVERAAPSALARLRDRQPPSDPPLRPLAPGLWWVPGAAGDGSATDRGQVSNLAVAVDGARTWLLGSGPTPAFGQRLAAAVRRRLGRTVTDLVSPWARPELVLAASAFPGVRHWAHADVADAMAVRCPHCLPRLRERLGAAADDLGPDPVRLPTHRLQGVQGSLGPWDWWRFQRAADVPLTVWRHRASRWTFAPGLLWGGGAPDGRDADLDELARATAALATLARPGGPIGGVVGWIGEQGPPLPPDAAREHAAYWTALRAAADAGVADGETGDSAPASLPGVPAAMTGDDPRHALNWQRAWRQSEERWFQRSLR